MRNILILIMILLTTLSEGYAEFPLESYEKFKNQADFKDYMLGVARGAFWANASLEAQDKPPLFCMPRNLALDEGIALSVLDQAVRERLIRTKTKDATIELALVNGLIEKFPCDDKG